MKKIWMMLLLAAVMGLALTPLACSDGDGGNGDADSDQDTADTSVTDTSVTDTSVTDTSVTDTSVTDTMPQYNITASVVAPTDFAATPTRLLIAFYDAFPPGGLPTLMGETIATPTIDASTPYALSTAIPTETTAGPTAAGDYYMAVSLFVEGGGTAMPVANVDYVGASMTPITFPLTEDLDIGDINLELFAGFGK